MRSSAVARKRSIILPGLPGGASRLDIRAEAAPQLAEVAKAINDINVAFQAFKAQNDNALAELAKRGSTDVITAEHVTRINTELTGLTSKLNDMQQVVTALKIGAGNDNADKVSEEVRAHAVAFRKYMRRGEESNLGDLQVKASLTSDSNPDGGYTVPEDLDRNITRVLETVSAMRRISGGITIGTDMHRKLHNLGGTGSGWVGEKDSRPQTANGALTELQFPTHEIYAMPAATQKLLDDSFVNIDAWLQEEVGIAFTEEEADAFINGDGNKKPRGFLQYTKVADASYAWGKIGYILSGQSAGFKTDGSGYDALVTLMHSLKSGYRNGAVWLMGDATLAELRKVKDADGRYVWLPPTVDAGMSVLGKQVEIDDNMPALEASSYSLAFGNFNRGYLIVDRMGTRVLRDPYTNKPYVMFYVTKRVGGGVQDFAAIKLMKFASS